ncbi:MAG: DUF5668 domain-containing protein [bacterium]
MTPARFRWGMFLILLGVLLLLRNTNVFNDNFWPDLLIWFPVVLIAVGIEKIFAKTRVRFISYLTSVGLFLGGLFIAASGSLNGSEGNFFSASTYQQEFDPSVETLHAVLELDETDLTIRDSGEDGLYARFDRFTRKPKITYRVRDNEATVTFISRSQSLLGGAIVINTDDTQDWYLRFPEKIPLNLECTGNGADLHLNLSTTPLQKLKLMADDARVYLKLGDLEPYVKIDIAGEDSNLRLRVPHGVGLKVLGQDYRSYLSRIGLVSDDDGFMTSGFDSAGNHIEINLDDRLGSLSIDFF